MSDTRVHNMILHARHDSDHSDHRQRFRGTCKEADKALNAIRLYSMSLGRCVDSLEWRIVGDEWQEES